MVERPPLGRQIEALKDKWRVPLLTDAAAKFREANDNSPGLELYTGNTSFFGTSVDEVSHEAVTRDGPFRAFRARYDLPTVGIGGVSVQAHVNVRTGPSVDIFLFDAKSNLLSDPHAPTDQVSVPVLVEGQEVSLYQDARDGFSRLGLQLMSSVLASVRTARPPDFPNELTGWTQDAEVRFHPRTEET
jgi:hypothetical protein